MLSRYPSYKFALLFIDLAVLNLSILAALWAKELSGWYGGPVPFPWNKFVFMSVLSLGILVIFREQGLYKHRVFMTKFPQAVQILKSLFYGAVVFIAGFFALRGEYILHSRSILLMFLFNAFFLLVVARITIFRTFFAKYGGSKLLNRRVLVIGAGEAGQKFAAQVVNDGSLGLEVVGFLDDDPSKLGWEVFGRKVLGRVRDLGAVLRKVRADEIVIAINRITHEQLLRIVEQCRSTALPLQVLSDHFKVIEERVSSGELERIPWVTLKSSLSREVHRGLKRGIDRVGALGLLILLSPLLGLIALCVKLCSRGPVFYKTQVIGKDGKPFTWRKFRTMVAHNDDALHRQFVREFITSGNPRNNTYKIKDDPRVTKVGRILRRFSLDELPQLFNVLRGEMSLIGPRPCLPYEYENYRDWHKRRFQVTPGLTGLWQVSGRSAVTFDDMVVLDLYYIENFSLWLDLKILLKTIPVVVLGKGGG